TLCLHCLFSMMIPLPSHVRLFLVSTFEVIANHESLFFTFESGINRMGATVAAEYLRPLVNDLGLSSVLLFPSLGGNKRLDDAFDRTKNPLLRVVSQLKSAFPKLCIIADVCLCTFTETGIPS